jgi:hypothetical protein
MIFGLASMLRGATGLAGKRLPRALSLPPILDGLIGIAVGLFGLGNAARYTHAMTVHYAYLFVAGASYGVWLVLVGGLVVFVVGLCSPAETHAPLRRVPAAIAFVALLSVAATLLAPR